MKLGTGTVMFLIVLRVIMADPTCSNITIGTGGLGLPRLGPACLAAKRTEDPQLCRRLMSCASADPDAFWYGAYFGKICPLGSMSRNASCFNILPEGSTWSEYETLGSRLFLSPQFTPQELFGSATEVLEVVFHSPPGLKSGCNSTQFMEAREFDANPSSPNITTFFTRNPPTVRSSANCTSERPCTLVLYDAAAGVVHNIFANWPRDDVIFYAVKACFPFLYQYTTKQLKAYHPPANPRLEPNTYTWLLYEQTPGIPPPQSIARLAGFFPLHLTAWAKKHGLKGPVGVTWMPVGGDEYAATRINALIPQAGYSMTCPALLEQRLLKGSISRELNINVCNRMLDYWMNVAFGSQWVDSIENGLISYNHLSHSPNIFLYPRTVPSLPEDLDGKELVLMIGSPANVSGQIIIVQLLANVAANDVRNNTQLIPYQLERRQGLSQVYILLLEQKQPISQTAALNYLRDECSTDNLHGCEYNLPDMMTFFSLRLAGLARFTADFKELPV